jgi:DNA recombination protein Rad52
MPPGFSPEQLAALSAPLDRANVRQREQGRSRVSYLEGWQVIAEANRIFGFDGWQRQTIAVRCVAQAERTIGRDQKPGWGVTYTARVRVTVTAGGLPPLIREGSGAGHGIDVDLGQAHESALKEAETDAMKRALMTFGNPFGLALYDKAQRQVSSAAGQGDGAQQPGGQRPAVSRLAAGAPSAAGASPAQGRTQAADPTPQQSAPADPGQQALDADTIQHLHSSLRALPRPQLESLTRAFRKRFQVPEEAVTIADRINQRCHHDWIEAYLVQQQVAA